jgi:hypothetical protein
MLTLGNHLHSMASCGRALDADCCEATQADCWLSVPTIILCETRGLWLFWVVRGGIGLTRRLGASLSVQSLMSDWILSLEPSAAESNGPPPRHDNLADHLSSATLKLLAASVVLRRNVPPFSRVSKQWPRSCGLRSDAPSRVSFPSLATPHRSRVTAPHHSWLG